MEPAHSQCFTEHFASPYSIIEEPHNQKANSRLGEKTLEERILFFEGVSTSERAGLLSCSRPAISTKVALLKEKFSGETINEDGVFASSELDSFSSVNASFSSENDPNEINEGSMHINEESLDIDQNGESLNIDQNERSLNIDQNQNNEFMHINNEKPKEIPANFEFQMNGIFPTSSEIIRDFTKFSTRPTFLNIPSLVQNLKNSKCIKTVKTMNLYRKKSPLFSSVDISRVPVLFRAPGPVLSDRPLLTLFHSILTETGTFHYIKISGKISGVATTWFVLKSLEKFTNPEMHLASLLENDRSLSLFILSDIVDEVYKRSNFLLFNGERVFGRFVGKDVLCLCKGSQCIKTIKRENIEKMGKKILLVGDTRLELSCEIERDEWMRALTN